MRGIRELGVVLRMMQWIIPEWPAPPAVRAVSTTRIGGVSDGPYRGLNLAEHVGDAARAVAGNRRLLRENLALPSAPRWLQQVHGTTVVDGSVWVPGMQADGSTTDRVGVVCAVLTADCLPLLLCDRRGGRVAALHAGWRGLAQGVVEAGLGVFPCPRQDILVWLGPCIGPGAFEVGAEVRQSFVSNMPETVVAFQPSRGGNWLANLSTIARLQLRRNGVRAVFGGQWCTHGDAARFFSYRRDRVTGRMASLIWLEGH